MARGQGDNITWECCSVEGLGLVSLSCDFAGMLGSWDEKCLYWWARKGENKCYNFSMTKSDATPTYRTKSKTRFYVILFIYVHLNLNFQKIIETSDPKHLLRQSSRQPSPAWQLVGTWTWTVGGWELEWRRHTGALNLCLSLELQYQPSYRESITSRSFIFCK